MERRAIGYLTLDRFPDGRDLWLLGTGTGLAPFLPILQDLRPGSVSNASSLVYSARTHSELAYQQLIEELPQRDYLAEYGHKLTYLLPVTREHVPGALHGRITSLLASGELERAAGLALNPHIRGSCSAAIRR